MNLGGYLRELGKGRRKKVRKKNDKCVQRFVNRKQIKISHIARPRVGLIKFESVKILYELTLSSSNPMPGPFDPRIYSIAC